MATKIKRDYEEHTLIQIDHQPKLNQSLEDDGDMYNVGVQIWAGHS